MKFRNVAAATAALTLAVSPVVAQAAPADRASAPTEDASEMNGGGGLVLAILAAAAIVAAIVIAAGGGGNDDAVSP